MLKVLNRAVLPAAKAGPRKPLVRTPLRLLSNHQSSITDSAAVSPHIGFYKTFGRPIAKVLLMATFTYQLSYWVWTKLEKDEIRSNRQAEISALETKLRGMVASIKSP